MAALSICWNVAKWLTVAMTEMRLYGMGKCLSMAGIHGIPTSWLPFQIIVGAHFVYDMIVQLLAKVGILRRTHQRINARLDILKMTERLFRTLALTLLKR